MLLGLDDGIEEAGTGDRLVDDDIDHRGFWLGDQLFAIIGGHHDDERHFAACVALLDFEGRLEPVHTGHAPIEQKNVVRRGAGLTRLGDGLPA
ncbi:hypothetical protein D3C78_1424260 [compost metagenome]